MASVTVEDLDKLVKEISERQKVSDEIEEKLKAENKEIELLKVKATNYLRELGRQKYQAPFGTVSIIEHFQVKLPQTPEDKTKLFEWMRERGIFDAYATVNSNSLKSLFKAEREIAIKEGQDPILFSLPGVEPATIYEGLKFTKTKEIVNE